MDEKTYELPADVEHEETMPTTTEEASIAQPPNTSTLEEMNNKLDAILAALNGKDS